MKQKSQIGLFFCLLINMSNVLADSSDDNWEKRISTGLMDKAEASDFFWLGSTDSSFIAIFNRHKGEEEKGAAIILHSVGGHADWPEVVSPLRNMLPEFGWATLSIQLPLISPEKNIEEYGKTFEETGNRILLATRELRKRGFSKIVIIGHGFGALSTLVYLGKGNSENIDAFVAISLQNYVYIKPRINLLRLIKKIKTPTLDLYGSLDFKEGIESAPDRRLASKKSGDDLYMQIEIKGADHSFNNMEKELVKQIIKWIM